MTLTHRELDVTRLVAEGYSNQAIALRLGIGTETVKCHMKSIFKKLKIGSRVELAIMYLARLE